MAYLNQAPTNRIQDSAVTGAKIASSVALAGNPTTTTQAQGNNSTRIATTAYVQTEAGLLIPKSIVDAKGDLIVGSAADTVVRHAAGSDGTVPVFDSTQSDGIENRLPAAYSASLIMSAHGHLAGGAGGNTRILNGGDAQSQVTDTKQMNFLFWSGQFAAVTGWTQEILIVYNLNVNATAPGADVTFSFRPVTANGGGAGVIATTLGTALGSSTETITAPAAGMHTANTGWITAPTANGDFWALCMATSGAIAANSHLNGSAFVYHRFVN